jgi:nucleotide-binding universal stress UspA family protein
LAFRQKIGAAKKMLAIKLARVPLLIYRGQNSFDTQGPLSYTFLSQTSSYHSERNALTTFFIIKGGFMISKILVPSDGSKTAKKAAAYAVDLAQQLKASIIILSVIEQSPLIAMTVPASKTASHTIEPMGYYLKEAAERYTGEIKKMCDKKGVASKISIKTGHPVDEIVKEAKMSKADLIVMGSHGRSALSATILGSVSYGVIHNDKRIHVLIVRV